MSPTDVRQSCSIILIGLSGACITVIIPAFVLGLTTSLHLTDWQAGRIVSAEMAGLAGGAALVGLLVRAGIRRLLKVALAIVIAGNLLSFGAGPLAIIALRGAAGLGEGALIAIMSVVAAGTAAPERLFGLFLAANMLISASVFALLTPLVLKEGIVPALLFLLALPLLTTTLVRGLPMPVATMPTRDKANLQTRWGSGALAVAGNLLFYCAIGSIWPQMASLARRASVSPSSLAYILSIATLFALLAGLAASHLALRLGRIIPLTVASIGLSIAGHGLGNSVTFVPAALLFLPCWVFAVPYYLGIAAASDPSGRIAAWGMSVQFIGLAIGPMISAALAAHSAKSSENGIFVSLITSAILAMMIAVWRSRTILGGREETLES